MNSDIFWQLQSIEAGAADGDGDNGVVNGDEEDEVVLTRFGL